MKSKNDEQEKIATKINYEQLEFAAKLGIHNYAAARRMFNWVRKEFPDMCSSLNLGKSDKKFIQASEEDFKELKTLSHVINVVERYKAFLPKVKKEVVQKETGRKHTQADSGRNDPFDDFQKDSINSIKELVLDTPKQYNGLISENEKSVIKNSFNVGKPNISVLDNL